MPYQLLLRDLQRKVTVGTEADLEGYLCEFPEYPYLDRAVESPALPGSVGSPGVVNQPAGELDENRGGEEPQEVDELEGLAVEKWCHGRPGW